MDNKKTTEKILIEEYSKIKRGLGMPFHVLADKLAIELFDLFKKIRKIDNKFPLQIEEISFIAENKDKIPRWKIAEKFDLKHSDFAYLKQSIGISFREEQSGLSISGQIKWLIEEELKLKINDELPVIISADILREHRLSKLQGYVYDLQKENKELYPLPSIFLLIDLAYPNIYKPWQFRGLKSEYWKDEILGKIRLGEALRWFVEEKKKIPINLISNLKRRVNFVTTRELSYYHIGKNSYKHQFNTIEEFINFTYPENIDKVLRESAKILIDKLKNADRIIDRCEICELRDNLEIHHIIPLWVGGTNDIYNLISLCSNHHTEAHKKNYHQIILSKKIKTVERINFFKNIFLEENLN